MEVSKYRAAARDYCTKVGIDPDGVVQDDEVAGFRYVTNYRWVIVAREMARLNTMMSCLKQHGPNVNSEG